MENGSKVIVDYTEDKVFIPIQLVYLREAQCLFCLNTVPCEILFS